LLELSESQFVGILPLIYWYAIDSSKMNEKNMPNIALKVGMPEFWIGFRKCKGNGKDSDASLASAVLPLMNISDLFSICCAEERRSSIP